MKHRCAAVALLLTVLALWACVSAGQARAATGSIAGTVSDAVTHARVADIQVYASRVNQGGPPSGEAITGADGSYVMSGLAPGDYTVWFNDQDAAANGDYADEWYDDNVTQDFSKPVVVADGARVTGIDAALSGCGTIYGWVEDGATRLLNAFVQAFCWIPARQEWEWYPLEFQDVDPVSGEYSLRRVRVGQWAVRFGDHGDGTATYAGEYYGDAHFVWDAQMVLVVPGSSVFVKGDLDLGGTLRGHVFDRAGTPVVDATVALLDWDPDRQHWGWSGMVTPTTSDGSYTLDGLDTWTYRLAIYPPDSSGLASEYWDNSAELDSAADLSWSIGQIRDGYDVWLGTEEAVDPVTSLSGVPASGWSRLPLTLALTSKDTGSGVELTQYRLDGAPWTMGTAIRLPAPLTHANDGRHIVAYRSADFRGNWEQVRTRLVWIDTQGPTTSALAGVSVKRGAQARFPFRVSDRSPTAQVTIRIFKDGKLMKRLRTGAKPAGRALEYRWTCSLARGSYTWKVYATDKAGNQQVKIGARPLKVN